MAIKIRHIARPYVLWLTTWSVIAIFSFLSFIAMFVLDIMFRLKNLTKFQNMLGFLLPLAVAVTISTFLYHRKIRQFELDTSAGICQECDSENRSITFGRFYTADYSSSRYVGAAKTTTTHYYSNINRLPLMGLCPNCLHSERTILRRELYKTLSQTACYVLMFASIVIIIDRFLHANWMIVIFCLSLLAPILLFLSFSSEIGPKKPKQILKHYVARTLPSSNKIVLLEKEYIKLMQENTNDDLSRVQESISNERYKKDYRNSFAYKAGKIWNKMMGKKK